MKFGSIKRSSKLSRVFSGGFVLLLIFTLLGTGYPNIASSFRTEASATDNSKVTTQDSPVQTNGTTFPGGAITINDSAAPPTTASPYPSTITVSGMTGVVGVVNVTLTGFSHAFPDDVDIFLKGPTGANAIILSDVGGSIGVSNLNIVLDDNAASSLPDAGPLTSGTFKPTNVGAGDTFPTQAPSGGSVLSAFNGTNPNGVWSLYVVDDANSQAGSIGSWSLSIATVNSQCNTSAITINPGGVAGTYPSDITVSGLTGTVSRVTVTINGFSHNFADDVDMLLEGPTNNRALNDKAANIWSDVGPAGPQASVNITLDDFAATSLPHSTLSSGTFKPTNIAESTTEIFPAPGPGAVPESQVAFSVFNGTNPNGTWHLWIKDDTSGDGGSISGGWCLTIYQGGTLARFSSASATASDDGQVSLKWKTDYEVDNLGFNVYRDEGGTRTRVNKQIIAGSAFVAGPGTVMAAGHNYKWTDNTSNPNAQYWIETLDINGGSIWHGPVSPTRSPGRSGIVDQSATLGDLNRGGSSTNAGHFSTAGVVVEASTADKTALKLGVKETGYYRVAQSDLVAAGLNPGINPKKLQLFEDGIERPIIVQGEKDGQFDAGDWVEFYATAADNAYTDTHVYRLVAGSQKGLRIKTAPETSASGSHESFLFSQESKTRDLYYSALRNGDQENFFGGVVAREPLTRTLSLHNLAGSAPDFATLEVALQGITTAAHRVKVVLNDSAVGVVTFDGQRAGNTRISVAQSNLREGDNTVQLIAEGGDTDVSLVDVIRVNYWHGYAADNDVLRFTARAGERITVGGFSNSAIRVVDLSDAEKIGVSELAATVNANGNSHSVTIGVGGTGTRTLLAFTSGQMKQPASIKADVASDWRQKGNKADLVIFTRKDFIPALQPLKIHRESQGLKVAIVDIEDVYDEFNSGNKSPQAIKDFLAYATGKWKVKPHYAIFAGDASLDPKNYLGSGDWDIVPTKLIDTQFMESASDEWFADFNGDGLAELAVGRLPVRSAQEMSTVVSKIIGYDSSTPSNSMLLVADEGDTFNFSAASEELRSLVPGSVTTRAVTRGTVDDATLREQLLGYLNQGQQVINYMGHGNLENWRGDLFTSEDAVNLTNGQKLSLFVGMTCLNGYFQEAATESLAEALLKAPHGGAVAAWASTGMSDPAEQGTMNKEFYRLLFGGKLTVGEAAMLSKASVKDLDVRRTWVLIGDPTTKLK